MLTTPAMTAQSFSRIAKIAVFLPLLLLMPSAAHAQVKLDAHYTASLAGISLGKGSWVIHAGADRYSAVINGGSAGLLKAFAGATGSALAQGRIANDQFAPSAYLVSINSKKTETIRISFTGSDITNSSIEPEEPHNPERIPVTEAHLRDVLDPMTASLVRIPPGREPLAASTCQGSSAIFDGRMRYELRLGYKRMDKVKAEKGYQGPVVVCSAFFTPVAGYVPDRAAIKYLARQRDMEVWLAPISDRILVPFKVVVPTPIGTGTLEATQFVVTVAEPAASAQNQ